MAPAGDQWPWTQGLEENAAPPPSGTVSITGVSSRFVHDAGAPGRTRGWGVETLAKANGTWPTPNQCHVTPVREGPGRVPGGMSRFLPPAPEAAPCPPPSALRSLRCVRPGGRPAPGPAGGAAGAGHGHLARLVSGQPGSEDGVGAVSSGRPWARGEEAAAPAPAPGQPLHPAPQWFPKWGWAVGCVSARVFV